MEINIETQDGFIFKLPLSIVSRMVTINDYISEFPTEKDIIPIKVDKEIFEIILKYLYTDEKPDYWPGSFFENMSDDMLIKTALVSKYLSIDEYAWNDPMKDLYPFELINIIAEKLPINKLSQLSDDIIRRIVIHSYYRNRSDINKIINYSNIHDIKYIVTNRNFYKENEEKYEDENLLELNENEIVKYIRTNNLYDPINFFIKFFNKHFQYKRKDLTDHELSVLNILINNGYFFNNIRSLISFILGCGYIFFPTNDYKLIQNLVSKYNKNKLYLDKRILQLSYIYDKNFDNYVTLNRILMNPEYDPNERVDFFDKSPIWYVIFKESKDPDVLNYILNDTRITMDFLDPVYTDILQKAIIKKNPQILQRIKSTLEKNSVGNLDTLKSLNGQKALEYIDIHILPGDSFIKYYNRIGSENDWMEKNKHLTSDEYQILSKLIKKGYDTDIDEIYRYINNPYSKLLFKEILYQTGPNINYLLFDVIYDESFDNYETLFKILNNYDPNEIILRLNKPAWHVAFIKSNDPEILLYILNDPKIKINDQYDKSTIFTITASKNNPQITQKINQLFGLK